MDATNKVILACSAMVVAVATVWALGVAPHYSVKKKSTQSGIGKICVGEVCAEEAGIVEISSAQVCIG